jgi:hypothetical protein
LSLVHHNTNCLDLIAPESADDPPRRGFLPATNFVTDLSGNAWWPNLTYKRWGHFKFQFA